MITKEQIDKVVNIIVSCVNPDKVILFGSYAYGKPTEDSDLDILVVKEMNLDRHKRSREIKKFLRGIKIPIDLIVYSKDEIQSWSNTEAAFITQIVKNGKVLYE
jgi:uncharacterized protein